MERGPLGLNPSASHPAVTSDARPGGDRPRNTGPELHCQHRVDLQSCVFTRDVRPRVAPRVPVLRGPKRGLCPRGFQLRAASEAHADERCVDPGTHAVSRSAFRTTTAAHVFLKLQSQHEPLRPTIEQRRRTAAWEMRPWTGRASDASLKNASPRRRLCSTQDLHLVRTTWQGIRLNAHSKLQSVSSSELRNFRTRRRSTVRIRTISHSSSRSLGFKAGLISKRRPIPIFRSTGPSRRTGLWPVDTTSGQMNRPQNCSRQ